MEPKTIPCPFCQRPLQISLKKNGKIGCRQCLNVSNYDAAAGVLTPLAAQNVKPANSRSAPSHATHHWVAVALLLAAGLAVAIVLVYQLWDLLPARTNSTVDELKALLKALAE